MVYSVLCEGVVQCSNTLEDEDDAELLPQALVYRPCRQRIYGLLLLHGHDGRTVNLLEVINTHADTQAPWQQHTHSQKTTYLSHKQTIVHLKVDTRKFVEESSS